ncbi:protein PTHB1 isoform X9 [Anas platyrhynchos]|uniref:protein PTHB1 isoform X9 n=1 Tax=Anas platyrhynchos TaxID=8839 RepID=UPI000F7C8617|eukprot:XP_027307213.1 protein PTHB1 isoform X8 [Anas platyrhynchos]
MSLFKARDWWSTTLGEKEEFDQGCLCVADVDNSGQDKIIVGSYMGYLRIFHPHPVKPGDDMQAEDLLLEVQLQEPILQVEVGKFVSGTEGLHLAVLHCRKLCVYAVSGTQGNVEHGNQYQIKLMYEHNLQRTACNMTYGPFGGVKGRDLICIQSMDGMLMLFEQESYAFGRFLPGFLLPGPLTYSSRTDSFITVSSCRQVESYKNLKGVIVTLSENGHLQCSYLGTDPSFFQAPRIESKEVNYEEFNAEMKELQKIIREAMKTQDILPQSEKRRDLIVTAEVSPDLDAESKAIDSEVKAEVVPSVTVKVTVQSRVTAQKPNLSVCVQAPLAVTCDQFVFNDLEPDSSETVVLSVFLKGNFPPSELEGNCVVSCSAPTELNPEGIPKVAQCKFKLPLRLICFPAQPSKSANHKITIDTNKPPISFLTIFPDFADPSEDDQANVLGFQFLTGSKITLLASKTSQRYRIQSDQLEDLWLITKELTLRLEEHFKKQNCKDFACTFSGSIPLQEYFELIDRHFELRLNAEKFRELLSERAVQFRAIERRLLTRFKDKTPAPLQHLDTLLEGTFREVIALADAAEENQANMFQAFTKLKSATHLVIMLISLWQKLNADQIAIMEAAFLPLAEDTQELGWEETVDSAISSLLRTCLSKSSKEQALTLGGQLSMPKDTSRLKKNISLFCDRLAKGGRLSLSTESATQQVAAVPGGCSTIPESDLEERVIVPGSTATFTNHKHAAKQKSKPDSHNLWNHMENQTPLKVCEVCSLNSGSVLLGLSEDASEEAEKP